MCSSIKIAFVIKFNQRNGPNPFLAWILTQRPHPDAPRTVAALNDDLPSVSQWFLAVAGDGGIIATLSKPSGPGRIKPGSELKGRGIMLFTFNGAGKVKPLNAKAVLKVSSVQ